MLASISILHGVDVTDAFQSLGIALGLGLLVGLQRERAEAHIAGVRTFALITILGCLAAALAEQFGGWVMAAGLAGVITAMVLGNISEARHGKHGSGITTEITILMMFIVGALVWPPQVPVVIPIVVGGLVVVLLHAKQFLHSVADRLGEKDVHAIMQFVLITLVILPVLPDENYGPDPIDVINPRRIWLMVVLVVGISLAGYALYKNLGKRAGAVLGGVLGGLVASTAMTVSFARRSVGAANGPMAGAMVIVLAATVVYARVIVEIAVVAPHSVMAMSMPILAIMLISAAVSLAAWVATSRANSWLPEQENPTELKSALKFGAIFTLVLIAVEFAHTVLDERGIYAVAALSGLANMDAITLSTAALVEEGRMPIEVGWRAIAVGSIANLCFKIAIVGFMGTRRLLGLVASLFAVTIAASVIILFTWPDAPAVPVYSPDAPSAPAPAEVAAPAVSDGEPG